MRLLAPLSRTLLRANKIRGPMPPYGTIRTIDVSRYMPTIMETREQSTKIGVGIPLGAELVLGPGRAIGELLLQYGTLDHVATGDSTEAISGSVGYRFAF